MRNILRLNIHKQLEYLDNLSKYTIRVVIRHFNRFFEYIDEIILDKLIDLHVKTHTNMDIEENDDRFIIKISLPDVKKEDIIMKNKDDILAINAVGKEKGYGETKRYRVYSKSIILSSKAEFEKTNAELKNGVLIIEVPKVKEVLGKKITIK